MRHKQALFEDLRENGKNEGGERMTRVYIGDKLVTKEELSQYEIRSEKVKKIIAESLAREKRRDIPAHNTCNTDN